jgi:hypothetical protein
MAPVSFPVGFGSARSITTFRLPVWEHFLTTEYAENVEEIRKYEEKRRYPRSVFRGGKLNADSGSDFNADHPAHSPLKTPQYFHNIFPTAICM